MPPSPISGPATPLPEAAEWKPWAAGAALTAALYLTSLHSYLLFHSLTELFSVAVAGSVFAITWTSRRYLRSGYLLFIGIGYLAFGFLDLLHTLAYQGMPVFPDHAFAANQLWIAARGLEAASLVAAFAFHGRERLPSTTALLAGFVAAAGLLVASIFWWRIFPACFVAGEGQTPFKISAEYVIIGLLALAAFLLHRRRDQFDGAVYRLLQGSLVAAIGCEFAFTLYVSNYGVANLAGHFLKILSYFLVHRAVVETCVRRPFDLAFRELAAANARLAEEVVARTAAEAAQAGVVQELRSTLQELKTLHGIIPICAHCKKIRNDAGSWDQLEAYLSRRADIQFSHGICPDCLQRHY
jgi:hypothetical protein